MTKLILFSIFAASILLSHPITVQAQDSTPLLKGGVSMDDTGTQAALDAADSEHEGKMDAFDRTERAADKDHETKLKLIEESDSTAKSLMIADENEKHDKKKKDIERKRALEEKLHAERRSAILKKTKRLLSDFASSGAPPGSPENPKDPLRGTVSNAPDEPVEGWSDESIPGRMMKLANEMDRVADEIQGNAMEAGNEFFGGLAESVEGSAKVLAEKPGTVLPKMIDGIITYLNNDHNENDRMLYEAAAQAVEEMQKNPARFFGKHAIDIALLGTGAAGKIGAAGELGTAEELGQAGKGLQGGAQGTRGMAGQGPPPRPSSTPPPPRPTPPPSREGPAYRPPERPSPPPRRPSSPLSTRPAPPSGPERPAYTPPERSSPPPRRPAPPRRNSPPSNEIAERQAAERARQYRLQTEKQRQQQTRKQAEQRSTDRARQQRLQAEQQQRQQMRKQAEQAERQQSVERQRQQAKDLEKAGETLKGMAEDALEFSSFDLTAVPKPSLFQIFSKGSSIKGLNEGMSFSSAVAAAKEWDGSVYDYAGTGDASITQILKRDFGNGNAKDPFHEGLQGLKSHQEGIPLRSSQGKIENALHRAGNDSQGLVFVDGDKGTPGYVFNALNNSGKVEFWDFQSDPPVQYKSFRSLPIKSKRVFFYRLS